MVTLVSAEKSACDIKQNVSFISYFVLELFAFKFYFYITLFISEFTKYFFS